MIQSVTFLIVLLFAIGAAAAWLAIMWSDQGSAMVAYSRLMPRPARSDAEALAVDWQAVGEDQRKAMDAPPEEWRTEMAMNEGEPLVVDYRKPRE